MTDNRSSQTCKPVLNLLGLEQKQAVHRYSLKILEETGLRVESKNARDIFSKSGAVKIENDRVYIQEEIINRAIKSSPSHINIYDKNGKLSFTLGKKQENETYFGIGVTNNYFQEIETNALVPFTRDHLRCSAKLGDMLDNFHVVSTIGVPSDAPVKQLDLLSTVDMYANTSKPLVLLSEGKYIHDIFKLLNFLHGDISSKPFIMYYFNPVTPLTLNEDTTEKMRTAIEHNIPVIFSNYSMYGGTTPVSEAGTLALLNAELLAGLVFSQLVREGSAVILGSLPAAFNMVTMGTAYTPSSYLMNIACAEMMEFYSIPHCGTSGSGNGWGADLLAAGDLWMNHLTSILGKVGLAPFVGGNFDSLAFSPSTVVLSDYIIGRARKLAQGFVINDASVNLEEIHTVGPGGDYFTSDQTLASLSGIDMSNTIWPPLTLNSWQEQSQPKAEKFLTEYTGDLYERAKKASAENMDLIRQGEDYIKNLTI